MHKYIAQSGGNEGRSDRIARSYDGLRPHEFFVIRYVPDVVRGEFVNIGVVVRESSANDVATPRRCVFALADDWRRVCEMFPNTDLAFLQEIGRDLQTWLQGDGKLELDEAMQFDTARNQLSLSLQMTDPQGCLTSDINVQLALLMNMYVNVRRTEYLLGVGEAVPAARYTDPWDGFLIDCGYSTAEIMRFYQAISIEKDDEMAVALARRAEALREGVLRVEGKPLEINAVVENPPDRSADEGRALQRYRQAVESMRAAGITVLTVDESAHAAQRARRELGLTG